MLTDDPFALLVGMMLDQQYPMEHAFRGPAKVLDRFGTLDPATIAAADPEEFAAHGGHTAGDPPLPGLDGRAGAGAGARSSTTRTAATRRGCGPRRRPGPDLLARVMALPGFGKQKAQIFVALLAKQLDVRPPGWEQAVGDYAEPGYRSVADVIDAASLQKVRDFKKAKKAGGPRIGVSDLRRKAFHASRVRRESARGLRAASMTSRVRSSSPGHRCE